MVESQTEMSALVLEKPVSETAIALPAPELRSLVSLYAGFRVSGAPPGVHHGLPKSDVDLIISLGRPVEILKMPNSVQRPAALRAFVAGIQDAPAVVKQPGDAFDAANSRICASDNESNDPTRV